MAQYITHEDYTAVHEAALAQGWKVTGQRPDAVLMAHAHSFQRLNIPLAGATVFPMTPEAMAAKIDSTGRLSKSIAAERELAEKRKKKRTAAPVDEPEVVEPPVEAAHDDPVPETGAELTVVSERHPITPSALRIHGRNAKPSHAVIERTWSDGSIDYACAAAECDVTAEKLRSISNHYGAKHKDQGETPVARKPLDAPEPEVAVSKQPAPKPAVAPTPGTPTVVAPIEPRTPEDRLAVIRTMLLPTDEVARENVALRAQIHRLQDEVLSLRERITAVAALVDS